MYKRIFILTLPLLLAFKCKTAAVSSPTTELSNTYTTTHFNIIFAPDLSNRIIPDLYKRPLNDIRLLSIIADNLYPPILRHKRTENQQDKIRVDFINKGLITQFSANTDKLLIDFGQFRNQNERINYIMERNGVKKTLRIDTTEMISEFRRINTLACKIPVGADIWSYFNQGIDDKRALISEPPVTYENNVHINTYRNILILTTDGYIEAGIFNKGFDLSKSSIDRFRKLYSASGDTNIDNFFKKNKQFRINPVNNENLKNMEVLVMELYDRSLTKDGATTVHPSDMEIIKLFWTDWLQQSKVKRFELHSYAVSEYEAKKTILNFLSIK